MARRSIRKVTTKTRVKPIQIHNVTKVVPKNSNSTNVNRPHTPNLNDITPITVEDNQLLHIIKKAIHLQSPLSVSRCGDGEFHLLKKEDDFLNDKWKKVHHDSICLILNRNKIKRCEIHNQSRPPDRVGGCKCYLNDGDAMSWIKMMRERIISTIKNSDYIGLNVPHKQEFLYGISSNVLAKNGIDVKELNVVNSLFPRMPEFGSIEGFKSIIGNHPIHFITSNARAFKQRRINELLKTEITYTDISGDRSYKYRDKVKHDIEHTDAKLIFFGGGGGIKDLIPWAATEHGKIAIDVGSIMDPWSGTQSRPVYEKPQFNYVKW